MVGTLLRIALLSSIVGIAMPIHDQLQGPAPAHTAHHHLADLQATEAGIVAEGEVHSAKSLHLEAIHLNIKPPTAAQTKEILKLAQEVQSPETLQRDMAKQIRVTAHHHGWDRALRVGIKNTVGVLDGMRHLLIASEKNLR